MVPWEATAEVQEVLSESRLLEAEAGAAPVRDWESGEEGVVR